MFRKESDYYLWNLAQKYETNNMNMFFHTFITNASRVNPMGLNCGHVFQYYQNEYLNLQ